MLRKLNEKKEEPAWPQASDKLDFEVRSHSNIKPPHCRITGAILQKLFAQRFVTKNGCM